VGLLPKRRFGLGSCGCAGTFTGWSAVIFSVTLVQIAGLKNLASDESKVSSLAKVEIERRSLSG
jgi:hypothetical protein